MFYNFLKFLKIKLFYTYLAGAIEADKKDGGQGWRDAVTPALDTAGIYVQDPCKTEPLVTGMDVIEAQEKFNGWIQSGNYHKFADKFEKIVEKDIRMVHKSDFIIVHLFPDIPTTGTIHEMAEAWRIGKPIYIIWTEAIVKLSKWAIYLCTSSGGRVFPNKKQLSEYIALICDLKRQSLRVQIIQFIKAIGRLIEERIYQYRLRNIKKSLKELEPDNNDKKQGSEKSPLPIFQRRYNVKTNTVR